MIVMLRRRAGRKSSATGETYISRFSPRSIQLCSINEATTCHRSFGGAVMMRFMSEMFSASSR